ncbi:MAG: MFS transporter [Oscillospiraceae bacterium]
MKKEYAQPSLRRLDCHYILLQVSFWVMFAAICAYQAPLLQARGFSNSQVGILVAVRCFAGVVFQPLLGSFADRHPKIPLKLILCLSLALSFLASVALMIPMGMPGTVLLFVILGGFEISAYPLIDSMAVQFINDGMPIRYSLGRGFGSLAYAVCCIFLSLQVGRLGLESTLYTHAAAMLFVILLVASFPTFRSQKPVEAACLPTPQSVPALLRNNPRFTLMLLGVMLGMTACLPLSNFFINVIESRGGTPANLGQGLFLMAVSELPTALIFQKMYQKAGAAKLLVVSMAFCTLKALLLLFSGNLFVVMLVQPLQMLGYGLFTPASVFFVNDTVSPADRVLGQTLMMVASNGLGGVLGSFIAGKTLDFGGANLMLLVLVLCGIAATALSFAAVKVKDKART